MIIKISLLCIFIAAIMGCDKTANIPDDEIVVNQLLSKISSSLEMKYDLKTIGTIVSMPGGNVKELGLDFQIRGPLSQNEIRKILIRISQDFIAFVNADINIRKYLAYHPFDIKNINITLFVTDSNGKRVDAPYIGIAGISTGILDYKILVTTDIPTVQSAFEESYSEALDKN